MLDVVTFEAIGVDKTKHTLQRNHSIAIAKHYGEDQGWSQSLDKLAEALQLKGGNYEEIDSKNVYHARWFCRWPEWRNRLDI